MAAEEQLMKHKLKALIYAQGLRQCDVARALGWREARLSAIITARQLATKEDIEALARGLGVETKEIEEAL